MQHLWLYTKEEKVYRVIGLVLRHFKPTIFGILSSGNLCLINHLILFWPYAASAASDVQTCKLVWGKKEFECTYCKAIFDFFFKVFKDCVDAFLFLTWIKSKYWFIWCFVSLYCLNFCLYPSFTQKILWILTIFIWGCWGCLRSKKFLMVDQA